MKKVILILLIILIVLIFPGQDIFTHTHWAWFYNGMLKEHNLLLQNKYMLSGTQPVINGMGTVSYIGAGFFWFFFTTETIKVLEILLFLGLVAISFKLFKNKEMLSFWFVLIFLTILLPDSYVYFTAMFMFYLGLYILQSNDVFGTVFILLAGLTHIYVAFTNLITFFFKKRWLFILSVLIFIFQIIILRFFFFAQTTVFQLGTVGVFLFRSFTLLFPFLSETFNIPIPRINLQHISVAFIIFLLSLFFIPFLYMPYGTSVENQFDCFYNESYYSELPQLSGNVRMVDDCRRWIYAFPILNYTSSQSPYEEAQHYFDIVSVEDYLNYINKTNTAYVIICKSCKVITLAPINETKILEENFPIFNVTNRYMVFRTTKFI